MIAGGGNIGERLARAIEGALPGQGDRAQQARAPSTWPTHLKNTLVLRATPPTRSCWRAENIEDMDLFLALTNDDENNIMSSLLAKRMGARRVLALINRRAYVDLVQADRIDIAISPAQVSIGSLLAHVRRGDVAAVHSAAARRGRGAGAGRPWRRGNPRKVVGRRIEDIDLPKGATIGALVRRMGDPQKVKVNSGALLMEHHKVIIAHHDTVIESDDHVIIFVVNKRLVPKVEKLFQVGLGFF